MSWPNSESKEHLGLFFEVMRSEYLRHLPEKGISWKHVTIEQLEEITLKTVWEIVTPENILYEINPDQLIDIALMCGMLWTRVKERNFTLCQNCDTADCREGYNGNWCTDYANADMHPYDPSINNQEKRSDP